MPLLRSIRLFNAIENANYTSATLEALLAGDQGRRNEMAAIAGDIALMQRLASMPAAAAVVLGSAKGREAVFASPMAMEAFLALRSGRDAIFNTPAVMTALAASVPGMQNMGDSMVCKMALSESATAMAAVLANSTALATLRAAPAHQVVVCEISQNTSPIALPGGRYIVLGAGEVAVARNLILTLGTVLASGSGGNTVQWTIAEPLWTPAAPSKGACLSIQAPFTQLWNLTIPTYTNGRINVLRCDI